MVKKIKSEEKQPFISHLKELRDRLVVCIVATGIAFIVAYYFKEKIFYFLMQPFIKVMPEKSSFIFTYVTEAFITYFKISLVAAIFAASPVILYEIWMFVSPGLYEKEKKYAFPFIFYGSICFICGALFCYFVIMPFIYRFFVSYAAEFIIPMPDLKGYMNLTLKLLIAFGLIFEMPLMAFYLGRAGIIDHKMLSSKRRYAILGIFILSAVITPPDVSSQIFMAIPLWGLYELSILIVRLSGKRKEGHE
ncbi:MAG: twin-arginine translocase subunit TatC [Syntrophorhabdaceae bacterium]|nr:twin-arginine translocase subunit TatC [Syntrophorhabdaceae bacterium]